MSGKKARQLRRIVETQWLSFSEALELIIKQWEVLAAYFQAEADKGGAKGQQGLKNTLLIKPKFLLFA